MPQFIPHTATGADVGDAIRQAIAQQEQKRMVQEALARQAQMEAEKVRQFGLEQSVRERQVGVDEGVLKQRIDESNRPAPLGQLYPVDVDGKAVYEPGPSAVGKPQYREPKAIGTLYPVDVNGKPVYKSGDEAANQPQYREPPKPEKANEPRYQIDTMVDPATGKEVRVRINMDTGRAEPLDTGGLTPKQTQKPVTGSERQVVAFYNRAQDADKTAVDLEPQIAQMSLAGQGRLEYAPNFAQSQLGQSYRQAQRTFTEARLRKESGATVPQNEYDNDARTYFAVPGDSAETIKQKRLARQKVKDGLAFAAGRAYDEFYGKPYERSDAPKSRPKWNTATQSWE